jgi:hypothetical protein
MSSPLPNILPKLPEVVLAYDNLVTGSLAQFMRFSGICFETLIFNDTMH